ncbi:MAG TPA: lysylphosphatidylglycerol synthase transmembrane domain-containing protein [Candidatus Methanoperedens sp.]
MKILSVAWKSVTIKLIITLILFFFIFYKLKLENIYTILVKANLLLLLLAAVLSIFFSSLMRSYKWQKLLGIMDVKISIWRSFRLMLIGIYYGMITPGKFGEIMKIFYLKERKSVTLPSVLWDRIIDLGILIVLTDITIFILFKNNYFMLVSIALTILFFLLIYILFNSSIMYYLFKPFGIMRDSVEDYRRNMLAILKSRKVILPVFISAGYYMLTFLIAALILKALDQNSSFLLVLILPATMLLGNIPVTISGLGLRELVSVMFFTALNQNPSIGFSFSIVLFFVMTFIPGLIGYVLLMKNQS